MQFLQKNYLLCKLLVRSDSSCALKITIYKMTIANLKITLWDHIGLNLIYILSNVHFHQIFPHLSHHRIVKHYSFLLYSDTDHINRQVIIHISSLEIAWLSDGKNIHWSKMIPYVHHHNRLLIINRSWLLTIHKVRILQKKLLK